MFRLSKYFDRQTYVELLRELITDFDRWCSISSVSTFEGLQELILTEQFKSIVPKNIATYINENKPRTYGEAEC